MLLFMIVENGGVQVHISEAGVFAALKMSPPGTRAIARETPAPPTGEQFTVLRLKEDSEGVLLCAESVHSTFAAARNAAKKPRTLKM
jgi:hypothetical protein